MTVMMLRPKIKPEHLDDVRMAATHMFAALAEAQPEGVRYASLALGDGETFVVVLEIEDGIENPLPAVPEFAAFQEGLREWVAGPAVPERLEVVGSYRLF